MTQYSPCMQHVVAGPSPGRNSMSAPASARRARRPSSAATRRRPGSVATSHGEALQTRMSAALAAMKSRRDGDSGRSYAPAGSRSTRPHPLTAVRHAASGPAAASPRSPPPLPRRSPRLCSASSEAPIPRRRGAGPYAMYMYMYMQMHTYMYM